MPTTPPRGHDSLDVAGGQRPGWGDSVPRQAPNPRPAMHGAPAARGGWHSGVADGLRQSRLHETGGMPTVPDLDVAGAPRGSLHDARRSPGRPGAGHRPAPAPARAPTDEGSYDDAYTDGYDDAFDDGYTDDAWGDGGGEGYHEDGYGGDDGDDEAELDRRRGCRPALIALLVVALLLGGVAFGGWRWLQGQIDPSGPPGEVVVVELEPGTSKAQMGRVLEDNGVIASATVWQWYTRVNTIGSIQAGTYEMRQNMSFSDAIDVLEAGPIPPDSRMVTVREGLRLKDTVALLADPETGIADFTVEKLQAALESPDGRSKHLPADQPSIEGTLFPETYLVEDDDDEQAVVERMVKQFDKVMKDLHATSRADALGLSSYEVLIVASLVEGETRVDAERDQVARVIYNRLEQGKALGIDATSCYEKDTTPCKLTTEELDGPSPYSTRKRPGLPPTPIGSPGKASIEAALNPADGPWEWYVRDADADDGSHIFTDDYQVFLDGKAKCKAAGRCG